MQPEPPVEAILGEHPYATLVAEIRDFAIFIIDLNGRIVSWNEGARLIFGYEKEEIIGQLFEFIFLPEDRQQGVPQREMGLARSQGRAEDVRWHQRKDGSRFWANGVTTALHDGSGQPRGFAKVARDDTRQKQREDDLRQSQERFDLLARATNDAIWDWDLITDKIWWNNNLTTIFGHALDAIEDSPDWWKERVHPNDRQRVVATIHAVIDGGGQAWASEYRFARANGSYADVFDRGYVHHDSSGRPVRILGAMMDMSERKKSEAEREELLQRLEFERARFSTIFQEAPAFVAVLRGPQHVFEMANPAYYQLVGHRDIIGKPLLEAIPEIEGQGFVELLNGVLHSGIPYEGPETFVRLQRKPNGPIEERFVDLLYQPLLEADGSISGVFSHGVDITELVRARRDAEDVNRVKDEFLATLSHELRTPLTAILGWTSILQSGADSPEENARALSIIERNARAQSQLIEDILDVSRVITGKLRLEVEPVDLTAIIEESVSTVTPAAQAKNIRLQRVLDEGASIVSGDPARLQQIVWNLLSNAIKFTPKDGRVGVRLERINSHLEIVVEDTGMGISPETLPHVFERFRQADSSSTRIHGGLGLGLAIVRHLVELHGGSVEAYSQGVGKGSVFTVKLPLVAVRPLDRRQSDAEPHLHPTNKNQRVAGELPRLDGLHVLIADDQEDTRVFLSLVLQQCGARVTTVASVPEAVATLQKLRPDVLLSDIGMPTEDGYSLIKQVRALAPENGGKTPAAALTAFARVEDRVKVLRSGFQIHLPKPVEPLELATVVANLAGRHEED